MSPSEDGRGHPGVMPVFLFQDTLNHYKPIIEKAFYNAFKKSIPS